MRKLIATLMTAAMVTTGCASAGGPRVATGPQPGVVDRSAMADYVQRLPAGSKVRVERTDGQTIRGTLMKATPDAIVVQKSTRVPEPPIELPIGSLTRVTLETGGHASTARSIGIGIASGVGAFFAILGIIAATWSD